jgi:metal-sulfur cluster biosynthetic enzyme
VNLYAQARSALATVYDPELDEPITELGFVASCTVSPTRDVEVRLRLPTPQCAPNFAFLMAADARRALLGLPAVGEVSVVLEGHYTGEEINAAVRRGGRLDDAFPGETDGDLDALRELFRRKALLAREGRVCTALLADGLTPGAIAAMALADLPPSQDAVRCLQLRRVLGLPCRPDAPALIAGDGAPLAAAELGKWLRRAQLVGISLETNGGLCRALLEARYASPPSTKEMAA